MYTNKKNFHRLATLMFCLFILRILVVASCHDTKDIGADRLGTKWQEIGSVASSHDILNGEEGYLDIYLRASDTVSPPKISLYCSKDGSCYFFLPSCTPLGEYIMWYDEDCYQVTIDNVPVHAGDKLDTYVINTGYTLSVSELYDVNADVGTTFRTLTFMQSENLPSVFISTATGSIARLNSSKEHRESGKFICFNADGSIDSQGALANVKGHGNSSYNEVAKKSFQITFDTATDVLSMGNARKYILQANAFDDTYLRNKIVYDYCKDLQMQYIVDAEYIDLYFNGEYAGNYLLCEKVELSAERIAVPNGYLIEKILHDRIEDSDQVFQVNGMQDFLIKNPYSVSETELQSLSEYMNYVEELVRDCDSYEKYAILQEYIDEASFVDMYLINAITNDIDANIASTYYYKKKDGEDSRLYAGPVWDYDNAWGRAERGYVVEVNAYPTGYCEELFMIEYFRNAVIEKYNSSAYPLMKKYLTDNIPQYIEQIASSIAMDTVRWQDEGYRSTYYTDYDSAIFYLNDYICMRMNYLYDRLNYPEQYHYILFVNSDSNGVYRDTEYWIKEGEWIPDEVLEEIKIHFHCETLCYKNGKCYDNRNPVFSDMTIYGSP